MLKQLGASIQIKGPKKFNEKYLNGILNPIEYLNNMAPSLGRTNYSPEINPHGNCSDGASGVCMYSITSLVQKG